MPRPQPNDRSARFDGLTYISIRNASASSPHLRNAYTIDCAATEQERPSLRPRNHAPRHMNGM